MRKSSIYRHKINNLFQKIIYFVISNVLLKIQYLNNRQRNLRYRINIDLVLIRINMNIIFPHIVLKYQELDVKYFFLKANPYKNLEK